MGTLPKHVDAEIRRRLAAIQSIFRPGAKVLLLIDNGCADTSVLIGDADVEAAIARIRELEGLEPSPSPALPASAIEGGTEP